MQNLKHGNKYNITKSVVVIKPVKPKEMNSEYSMEGLIVKLKFRYFGHLMGTADSLEKTLILPKKRAGGGGGGRRRDGWMASLTQRMC